MLELSANLLAELGGWPALKEARGLAERGKVTEARREGNVIRARVQGPEKIYEPQIVLAERVAQVEVRCTCAESRRSGRVCAHALAAGWALLHPGAKSAFIPAPAPTSAATMPKRWTMAEESGEATLECTILLPLQLKEALAQKSLRVILEARRGAAGETLPWETATRDLNESLAVSEEDARLLDALEKASGGLAAVSFIPREKVREFLRALSSHPRIWLGKRQRVEVKAATDRPVLTLQRAENGALELVVPASDEMPTADALPLAGWHFDGKNSRGITHDARWIFLRSAHHSAQIHSRFPRPRMGPS